MAHNVQPKSSSAAAAGLAATTRQSFVSVSLQPLAMNVQDAARIVDVPTFHLRECIGNGSLRARRAGRTYVVTLRDLEQWLESLDEVEPSPCFLKRCSGSTRVGVMNREYPLLLPKHKWLID
jgi:excisionase family DNA binding protein